MPIAPSKLTFETLKNAMKNHLQPTPSTITERYKFKKRRQKENKSASQYLANLKKLSTFCDFGASLKTNLRDQFVWGLCSETMKKRLLGEQDLTYARAVELAQTLEAVSRDVAEMGPAWRDNHEDIHFMRKKRTKPVKSGKTDSTKVTCFCCGKPNHKAPNCRFKTYTGNQCDKVGHLAAVCKNKNAIRFSKRVSSSQVAKKPQYRKKHNFVGKVDDIAAGLEKMC